MTERNRDGRLRVALVAGTLSKGGAEKQLVYMAKGLQEAGALVRVYCLTRGEYFEPALAQMGTHPIWVGQQGNPAARTLALVRALGDFKPHIVQSTHFYTNIYVALAAPIYGAISIGAIRSSAKRELKSTGRWSRWLLTLPFAMIANSEHGRANAVKQGVNPDRIAVLPNVIDLSEFDRAAAEPVETGLAVAPVRIINVARLIPVKRIDRFIKVLQQARLKNPNIQGILMGDGPLRAELERAASQAGLTPEILTFMGQREDVPAVLKASDIFLLTSDEEGFPNVVLEAMAARLPVVTTNAGDSGLAVSDGHTGFVSPVGDDAALVDHILSLAGSPEQRHQMGQAGRERVEKLYSAESLPGQLFSVYRRFAAQHHSPSTLKALEVNRA